MSENLKDTETIENQVVTVEETGGDYTPSSLEKKRAVMMYMFFGVIITISKKKVNSFEYFHLKQSIGWRLIFILVVIGSIVLMLIPGIKYIGLLALLAMIVFLVIFAKQARDGKYHVDMKKYGFFGFFPSLGTWVVDLFEVSPKEIQENNITQPTENIEVTAPTPAEVGTGIQQAAEHINVKPETPEVKLDDGKEGIPQGGTEQEKVEPKA